MGLSLSLGSVSMFETLMNYLLAPSDMDEEDFASDPVGPRDSTEPPDGEFEADPIRSDLISFSVVST